jgi:hypothetical protein
MVRWPDSGSEVGGIRREERLFRPTPAATVRVVGSNHVLCNELRQIEVPAGLTIAETLDLALIEARHDWPREMIVASVGDVRVPREHWARVRPKPGTVVVFRPVAGDDKTLRSGLFLALAIAALFVVPILGPIIGSVGAALVGGAITIGGSLLINALVPIRPPRIASGSGDSRASRGLPMLAGAQNEARPWETIPVVLGRHRLSPFYAARPYTFFSGQKQFLNLLFCVGYGPLAISQIKIGETPLTAFEEVDSQVREGYATDAATSLFPVIPSETELAVNLLATDGFVQRRTDTDADQISLDLVAVNGVFRYDHLTGKYADRPVTVNVRYRKVGDVSWTDRPDIVFTRSRDTVRRGDRFDVTRAQYDVQVRKQTAEYSGADTVAEAIQWIALRSFTHGHPVNFPKKLALIALRIRATDQLNGIINTLNLVAESVVAEGYDGSAWHANVISRNPADLFRQVLQGPANARPRSDAQLDLASLEDWWRDCVANDYSYNAVISENRSVREALADIAAAGRATVALRNGKWGVSFPRRSDVTAWHFTPRNFSGFSTQRSYREMPHGLRIRFINQDRGWNEDQRIVYADGYNAGNATVFEAIEVPGVTRSQNVWRHGRFFLAQAELRPETHTLTADAESLRLERGDRVAVTNDVLLVGTGYGRVKSVDGLAQTVTVDSRVLMEVGSAYQVRFRLADGSALIRVVFNTANETDTIALDPDLSTDMPEPGDLFSFGETDRVTRDYRVLDVRPGPDLSAQLTLVDDAPAIDDADTGEIPAYDPGITQPPDPYSLTPQSLTVSERLAGSGIATKALAQLTVQVPRVGTIRAFEFGMLDVDASGDWTGFAVVAAPHLVAERDDLEAGAWRFRVRSLFADGSASTWVESDTVFLLGLLVPPPDPTGVVVVTRGDVTRISWVPVAALNLSHYVVKFSPVTDGSATWGSSLEIALVVTNYAEIPARPGTFSVKAVTFSGIESVNAGAAISFVQATSLPNVVEAIDEDPAFAGVHSGTTVSGSLLELTVDSGGLYGVTGFYQFAGDLDLGAVYTSRLTAVVLAAGNSIGDTMDTWTTLADVPALDSTDPSQWGVRPVYRWTADDPGASGALWSDWIVFSIADQSARAFEFGIWLDGSADGRISPAVSRLGVVVDMTDRHVAEKNLLTGTAPGGLFVPFEPPFKALKAVTVSNANIATGETLQVVSSSAGGATFLAKSAAGAVISRTFDYHAIGYGVEIPTVT